MAKSARHPRTLRLGTRGSQLARWQAEWVAGELRRLGHTVELIEIATHGDVERTRPVEEIGTRGVFTKAIQQALLADEVDLAVHSLKDLPTEPVDGLMLAAVPKRESAADVLVCRVGSGEWGVGNADRSGDDLGLGGASTPGTLHSTACARVLASARGVCGGRRSCCIGGRICKCRKCAGMLIRGCGSWTRDSSMRSCWQRPDCGGWAWRIAFRRCCRSM